MKMVTLVATLAVVSLSASICLAQDMPAGCENLDLSSMDLSNPAGFASILPCTGWDSSCQSAVAAAGASCIQEIQTISQWANTSGVFAQAEEATGVSADNATEANPDAIANSTASIGASVSVDDAQAMITKYLPDIKKALGTCCGGKITATCCSAMTPLISQKCLCQEKPVEMLKTFIGQDPSTFFGLAQSVTEELGCDALKSAEIYPACQA